MTEGSPTQLIFGGLYSFSSFSIKLVVQNERIIFNLSTYKLVYKTETGRSAPVKNLNLTNLKKSVQNYLVKNLSILKWSKCPLESTSLVE